MTELPDYHRWVAQSRRRVATVVLCDLILTFMPTSLAFSTHMPEPGFVIMSGFFLTSFLCRFVLQYTGLPTGDSVPYYVVTLIRGILGVVATVAMVLFALLPATGFSFTVAALLTGFMSLITLNALYSTANGYVQKRADARKRKRLKMLIQFAEAVKPLFGETIAGRKGAAR